ncbi:hypothetical protein [Kingella potus]|nr:hypothetical protein [Kingella potus]UOP00919.1 hypothetical protein LVJ84_00375 [Kingella potus]
MICSLFEVWEKAGGRLKKCKPCFQTASVCAGILYRLWRFVKAARQSDGL